MAIVTSSNKKANTINSSNLNQLDAVFNSNSKEKAEPAAETKASEEETEADSSKLLPKAAKSASAKKREYTDTVVLNLPKGERSNFKVFCAKYDLTMTDFIYFAMDYVREHVEDGRFGLSRGGIKELKPTQEN